MITEAHKASVRRHKIAKKRHKTKNHYKDTKQLQKTQNDHEETQNNCRQKGDWRHVELVSFFKIPAAFWTFRFFFFFFALLWNLFSCRKPLNILNVSWNSRLLPAAASFKYWSFFCCCTRLHVKIYVNVCVWVCVSMFTIWALSSTWSWPDPLRPFPRSSVCWDTLCLTGAGLRLGRIRPGVPTGWAWDTWNKGSRGEEARRGKGEEREVLRKYFREKDVFLLQDSGAWLHVCVQRR